MARQIEFGKFLIIECSARELYVACDSPGVCDFCGTPSPIGYYIAVLNQWFCPKCFETWKQTDPQLTKEDAKYEKRHFDHYAPLLGIKCQ
jgi:hypothetical protein